MLGSDGRDAGYTALSFMEEVLLVEDDRLLARMLDKYLHASGIRVAVTYAGEAAWSLLSSDDPPLVALIDWGMHDISGPALCQRVREREHALYVHLLLITGRFSRSNADSALPTCANECITKPFLIEHVIDRVRHGLLVAQKRRSCRERLA